MKPHFEKSKDLNSQAASNKASQNHIRAAPTQQVINEPNSNHGILSPNNIRPFKDNRSAFSRQEKLQEITRNNAHAKSRANLQAKFISNHSGRNYPERQDNVPLFSSNQHSLAVVQRNMDDAELYIANTNMANISALPTRREVQDYVADINNPMAYRIGLATAYNLNYGGLPIPVPTASGHPGYGDVPTPAVAPAANAARAALGWAAGGNPTEAAIAAIGNGPVVMDGSTAAVGHDGGGGGNHLQPLIGGMANRPTHLTGWLWNRGLPWSAGLNAQFITEIINDANITTVHVASPTLRGHLNGLHPNYSPWWALGGATRIEVGRLLNEGGFVWNNVTNLLER